MPEEDENHVIAARMAAGIAPPAGWRPSGSEAPSPQGDDERRVASSPTNHQSATRADQLLAAHAGRRILDQWIALTLREMREANRRNPVS